MTLDTAAARATVTRVEVMPGAFAYPEVGGARFDGVRCLVRVEEIA